MVNKVKILTSKRKEPIHLDFYTFFHLMDNSVRKDMLEHAPLVPSSLHLYSDSEQTTKSFFLFGDIEPPLCGHEISNTMLQLMDQYPHDYSVTVVEAWRQITAADEREIQRESNNKSISSLPIGKKQEILLIYGRGEGKKESVAYDIIRIRPEDDESKILHFEKLPIFESSVKWLAEERKIKELEKKKKNTICIDTQTQNKKHYQKFLVDKKILLALKGNMPPWRPSTLESKATIYAYGFSVDNKLQGVTQFWLAKLQKWLMENMHKYELIRDVWKDTDNSYMHGLHLEHPIQPYPIDFVLVPLNEIPLDIIISTLEDVVPKGEEAELSMIEWWKPADLNNKAIEALKKEKGVIDVKLMNMPLYTSDDYDHVLLKHRVYLSDGTSKVVENMLTGSSLRLEMEVNDQ